MRMDELLSDIITRIKALDDDDNLSADELARIIRAHNENVRDNQRHFAKKHLLPFYLAEKERASDLWKRWDVDSECERKLFELLKMKPRRTASGVATITVITHPQPCASNCVYCPNDMRMPKSYLSNEPACQRAERNFFDPYLQICSRMQALEQMGHATDKVELIVLGGTWSEYPCDYQTWFIHELFRALNEWPHVFDERERLKGKYHALGKSEDSAINESRVASVQARVNARELTYNEAFDLLYENQAKPLFPVCDDDLRAQQKANESAAHRIVGLVIETRPDSITPASLTRLRALGCTKVQMGVQTTDERLLAANHRSTNIDAVAKAFALVRLFGFKIHGHLMVNLVGATPVSDKDDFLTFVSDERFIPDEIKLYPCALVDGTDLVALYRSGNWKPYTERELMDVLVSDVLATPPYIRISRMIRDISAQDILVGNKKTNLRQMVEGAIEGDGVSHNVQEIRFREINRATVVLDDLVLDDVAYTTSVSREHFLQWVTADNKIVGFLRLSLPKPEAFDMFLHAQQTDPANESQNGATAGESDLPLGPRSAMIREVHVYGEAAHLGEADSLAQHQGLGRTLVARALEIAREAGYTSINVISSVGTREYYRKLGFVDCGLYQTQRLR